MSIKATAYISSSSIGPDSSLIMSYVVGCGYAVFDGTTATGGSVTIYVPLSINNFKQADKLIRQGVSNVILSTLGLTIDSDDIYVPFS